MKLAHELRARATSGEVLFGTFVLEVTTPAVVPILKTCGFGFYVIDLEHGCFDDSELRALISAGKQYGLCPMVRVADSGRATITRALDAGAEGVMVAMVQTLDDVCGCVQSSKYPPLGGRGVHMLRPHTDFIPPKDLVVFLDQANRDIILGVQIETAGAVTLIDQIAAFPGVDLLYLGPMDLSVALGQPGEVGHEKVTTVATSMARACRAHGKLAGIHAADPESLARLIPEGVSLFGHAADLRLFWNGAEAFITNANQQVKRVRENLNEVVT